MIFAITVIIKISAPEVGTDHEHDPISKTEFLSVIPEEIQRLGKVIVKRFVNRIVLIMGVKAA